ncbi:MAG TPA: Uma2 family endonuclease [Rubrobacter sp.]|nr:Uma2 family endonuclease [Rubrobacter sp.]
MAEPTSHKLLTVEEYLALEKSATVKHEYVAGTIHAMVGTTKRHNRIALNIASLLLDAARGGSCRVYVSDVKVRTEDILYYPDVMVACGPEGADPLVEDNPCLVVDVVLPSTETTDRREKLAAYKRMPGLEAYLIISQNRKWVERHFRAEDGTWRRANLLDEGRVPIPCPECELSPAGIYEGLE